MAYTPRLTAPDPSDLRWIQTASGGYNACIYGSEGPPSVLPDCTGYVHGRCMELRGVNTDDAGLSFGNGATYWTDSSAAWTRSQDPSLGAILCYETIGTGQPGHVCVVEQVVDNDTVVVSESNWGGPYFRTLTCYRQHGWRPDDTWNVTPQGFLKNPYVDEEPGPSGGNIKTSLLMLMVKYKERRDKHGERITRIV